MAGSPMKPMPSEAIVMPSWQADRYSSMRSSCRPARRAPLSALVLHLLELGVPRAHERELRRDEESVGQNEHADADEQQKLSHGEYLLRGGSSSLTE